MKRFLFVAAAALPLGAYSQEPTVPLRYDYVGASLVVPDIDELGIALEGSTTVSQNLIVFGQYSNYEPHNGLKIDSLQIGVGRVWSVRRNLDFVASASYSKNNIDTPSFAGDKQKGVIVGGQLRGWATNRIELSGAVLLDHSKSSSTETIVELGVQYLTEARLSYGGIIRVDDDDSTVAMGMRFYFGASRREIPR
jgi:hypothetical protein